MKFSQKFLLGIRDNFCSNECVYQAIKSSIIWGFICHFFILTNYLYNHDSVTLISTNYDWLITQGKWFVTPLTAYKGILPVNYTATLIGIVAVSLSAGIICAIFHIRDKLTAQLIGCCLVSFPSFATTTLYNSADYFSLTILLAVSGAYFATQNGILNIMLSITLMVLSLGAYQAFIGFSLSIFVLICLIHLLDEKVAWQDVLREGIKYILLTLIAILFYYIILQVQLNHFNVQLSNYKGMNSISALLNPATLLSSCAQALEDVWGFFTKNSLGIYYNGNRATKETYFYLPTIVMFVFSLLIQIFRQPSFIRSMKMILLLFLTLLAMPLSMNIVGVLSQNQTFYYISIYPFVMFFLSVPILLQKYQSNVHSIRSLQKIISFTLVLLLSFTSLYWFISDNMLYFKTNRINNTLNSKLTTLVTHIQGTEGYTSDTPVLFWGEAPFPFLMARDGANAMVSGFETRQMGLANSAEDMVYNTKILEGMIINELAPYLYIPYQTEFDEYKHKSQIEEMAVYPNYGSIQYIDGYIVVKLNDN